MSVDKQINLFDRNKWFINQGFTRQETAAIGRFLLKVAEDLGNQEDKNGVIRELLSMGEPFQMQPGDYALVLSLLIRLPKKFFEVTS